MIADFRQTHDSLVPVTTSREAPNSGFHCREKVRNYQFLDIPLTGVGAMLFGAIMCDSRLNGQLEMGQAAFPLQRSGMFVANSGSPRSRRVLWVFE